MSRKSQSRGKASYKKTSKSERRVLKRRQEKMRNIWMMVGGAFIFVAAIILVSSQQPDFENIEYFSTEGVDIAVVDDYEVVLPPEREYPMTEANTMGDPNAPVVIEEFSDFQCGYCFQFFANAEQDIIDTYVSSGQVYLIFHSIGDSQNGDSGRAAEAAYCAGDQGEFWKMHDIIFTNYYFGEASGGYSYNRLTAMARAIDLDLEIFQDCLKSGKYSDKVEEDARLAFEYGAAGTPTFFINGEVQVGDAPFSTFQTMIENALAQIEE